MPLVLDIALLLLSFVLLWKGAEWIVDSAAILGRKVGLSDLVIGLTVVAFGTSAPEFAVTVGAALTGRGDIAVANVIGSNIFNIGIILGGAALFSHVKASRTAVRRDGPILVGVALLGSYMLWDGRFEIYEALILVALLVSYLVVLFVRREALDEELPEESSDKATWVLVLLLLGGLAGVATGGRLLVDSASNLAVAAGVPQWLIGLTIVAAGTSASELATSLMAVIRGRQDMLVGNLIGSDIFNMLGVLGVAGLLRRIELETPVHMSLVFFVLTCLFAAFCLRRGEGLSRAEGLVLVLLGLGRWAHAFIVS